MVKHINVKISGKVQGVFFRVSTKACAETLGVRGFVRNGSDNTVYIEAEAEEKTLNEFINWCQHGPPLAKVEHCDIKEGAIVNFKGFEIMRSNKL